jgi:hypothetical protein
MRYDMRPDSVGWTIYDTVTGRPAVLDDLVLVELELEVADDLANMLNSLDLRQSSVSERAGGAFVQR